ncbi:MAG TPA: hypothetical protein VFY29_13280 [Terriglobia bacterium]|nr:hypothetical protein [Terriglobia bacterium]
MGEETSAEDLMTVLGPLVGERTDIRDIDHAVLPDFSAVPYFALIELVDRWNSISRDRPIGGSEKYIDDQKVRYLDEVRTMQRSMADFKNLPRIFTSEWFDSVIDEVIRWDGRSPFRTVSHGAFITHLQFGVGSDGLLYRLDEAFSKITEASQRRAVMKKLRDMGGNLDAYISTIFEILVTSRFERILDYEPTLKSGHPEARVLLGDQAFLIEARATQDMAPEPEGAFSPDYRGTILAAKAREKYEGQLSSAAEPVVLFFGLNAYVNHFHVHAMLERIHDDDNASVLSAIMLSETCHALRLELWVNPKARFPLTERTVEELHQLFSATTYRSPW